MLEPERGSQRLTKQRLCRSDHTGGGFQPPRIHKRRKASLNFTQRLNWACAQVKRVGLLQCMGLLNSTVSQREACVVCENGLRAESCGPEDKACCLPPSEKHRHIWSPYDLDEATVFQFIFLSLEIEAHLQTQMTVTDSDLNNSCNVGDLQGKITLYLHYCFWF